MGKLSRLVRLARRAGAVFALLLAGAAAGWTAAVFLPQDAAAAAALMLAAAAGAAGWAARSFRRREAHPRGQHGSRPDGPNPDDAGKPDAGPADAADAPAGAGSAEPAGRTGPLIGGGESLAAELRLALEVQRKWQPPVDLRLGACRVTARSRQASDVGGDLFDAVVLDDAVIAVLVGDVPGKGLQAAFMVPALLLLLRSEVKRGGGPAQLLGRMNRVLAGLSAEGLTAVGVTLGIGLLNVQSGEMRYAGAGHPAPYLVMPGAEPRQLDSSSLPLGMNAEETYRETVFRLAPGERFVLYTDGVVEDAGPDGEMYGFDRLEAELAGWAADEPAADWMERLLDGQESRGTSRRDDRTLLVVECIAGKAGRRAELRERNWRVPSKPGCERSVAAELAAMLRADWSDSGRTDDIVTCVAEAVMNAAEHGNGFDAAKTVAIQVHFGHAIMVCRVRDEGPGFDPEERRSAKMARPAEDDNDYGRGWGLRLIDELTDYWIATRNQHGFCVEMYFLSHHRKS
jgi:anti-sigma regulatory factor (Ser/Thr protein kinase)